MVLRGLIWFYLSLVCIILALGCIDGREVESEKLRIVSPEQFKEYIGENDVFLLNVYKKEHERIPGTDAHIPYNMLEEDVFLLPEDKSTPIAIYCRLDPMSEKGSLKLLGMGYTNVTKLKGGTAAWRNKGYLLE